MDLGQISRMMKRPRRSRKSRYVKRRLMPSVNIRRSNISDLVHTFKRKCIGAVWQGNGLFNPFLASVPIDGLSVLVNGTEFTQLYDQYMITGVQFTFTLVIDPGAQNAVIASYPRLFWARDEDDSTNPASLDELRQYGNCKVAVLNPGVPVVAYCKPNALIEVYRNGVASTYNPVYNQWIDTTSGADARHYTFKVGIDNLTNTNYRVEIERTLYFKCKNTR